MSDDLSRLALFPLPTVVLYPRARVPLHVFEPRYRQMMEAALSGDRTIGMVAVPPQHQPNMGGDPPLFAVGCAGTIDRYEQLADGRYNLVLEARSRFRILQEIPREAGRLYRSADVRLLAESEAGDETERLARLRGAVERSLRELVRSAATGADPLPVDQLGELDDETFINTLCQILGFDTVEKQGLLEDPLVERAERLQGLLTFHLAAMRSGGAPKRSVH